MMTADEALKYFKTTYDLCKKIGTNQSNFNRCRKNGGWIPIAQQLKINQITGANMPIDLTKELMEERLSQNTL